MIRITCPHCHTKLEEPATPANGIVQCTGCGKRLRVPGTGSPGTAAPRPGPSQPAAPPVRHEPRVEREDPRRSREEDDGDHPRRRHDHDDEDHRRGKRKKHKEEKSNATAWIIVGSVAGVVIVGLIVTLILVLGRKDDKKEIALATPPAIQFPPGGPPPGMGGPQDPSGAANVKPGAPTKGPTDQPAKPAAPPAGGGATASNDPPTTSEQPKDFGSAGGAAGGGNIVYPYLLKSAAFIIVAIEVQTARGRAYQPGMGSGSLIDLKNRLVLTNHHVAGEAKEIVVFFPTYDKNGKQVAERERFVKQFLGKEKNLIKAKVIATNSRIDLCLLQLDRVPAGIEALPLSKTQATPGQQAHSVGTPGDSEGVFLYTSGTVRQVYHKRWRSGGRGEPTNDHEADVVETQSPTNAGDSGGPLVNDRGELIGVTHGGHPEANLLSLFIDVTEVRRFIESSVELKLGSKWVSDARPPLRLAGGGGGGNVTELVKNLESSDAGKRAKAAESLGEMGEGAKVAIPSLLKALKDPDDLTRRTAAAALNRIGLPAKSDVPLLAAALKDQSAEVRQFAAATLDKMALTPKSASGALVDALKDEDATVRQTAARTLGKLGTEVKPAAAKELTALLEHADKDTRLAAAEGLAGLLSGTEDMPTIQKMMKHKDAECRACGVRALAKLGKEAKAALPDLLEGAKSGDAEKRKAALTLLAALTGAEAKPSLPLVTQALKDGDKETKQLALQVVTKLGSDAQSIANLVRDALREPELRKDAIAAFAKIGANSRVTVPALLEAVKDQDEAIREAALKALGDIGPPAAGATNDLINLFDKAREIPNRADASAYLDKIAAVVAKFGRPAVPSLIKALEENNFTVRWGACKTLGLMGTTGKDAAGALLLMSQAEPNLFIAQEAEKAWRKVTAR